jgi:hypothetical protein
MKTVCLALFAALLSLTAVAQHGTAPTGYYPLGYNMDTWKGVVSSVNDATGEITLGYVGKKGAESFTGVLRPDYKVTRKDGTQHVLKPSDCPIGARLLVYYSPKTKKIDGKKIMYYEIWKMQNVIAEQN